MTIAYSVFADSLSQAPVFASPLDRGRFISPPNISARYTKILKAQGREDFLSNTCEE